MLNFEAFKLTPGFNLANYELGHAVEIALLDTIRTAFDDPELMISPEGAVFDYESPTRLVELKSRTHHHRCYPDTAIGKNKIKFIRNHSKEVIFIFKFTNGLFYWKYDPTITLRSGLIFGVPHCFIPIRYLKKI